ncbi:unnamed protein product, partial [Effrenium voratum]
QVGLLEEHLPELKSCEDLSGDYQVPKEGLELETCTVGKAVVQVHLLGPLTVRGNVTVLGNITFLGSGDSKSMSFQQACVTIGGTLSVSGSMVIENCWNNGADRAHGGCLNASDLVLEEGLLRLDTCKTAGLGGGASIGTLLQRGGEMNVSKCESKMGGGGLNAGSLVMEGGFLNFDGGTTLGNGGCAQVTTVHQRAGEARFIHCVAAGKGGGLAAQSLAQDRVGSMRFVDGVARKHGGCAYLQKTTASGNLSFESCRTQKGGGCGYAKVLHQSKSGQLICRNCTAESGGCLFAKRKLDIGGVLKASSVAAPRGSVLLMARDTPATLQRLEIQQARGVALDGRRMNISELVLGPSDAPFRVRASDLFLDSANCSLMEECTFQQHEENSSEKRGLVRPLCRRGSGLVEEDGDTVLPSLKRGCRRCPAGLAQLQQGAWAPCACPKGWTCHPEIMEMPQGTMPLNLSNLGQLSKCLSGSACPGGQLPHTEKPWCAPGHLGPLCAVCADHFHAAEGGCEACEPKEALCQRSISFMAAGLFLAGVLVAVAWLLRGTLEDRWKKATRWHVLVDLAKRQAMALLQLAQLYAVLGALLEDPTKGQDRSFWERKYMNFMQLNLAQVQDAVRAECLYHGPTVRLVSALASPVLPLVMLLACSTLELLKPSLGVSMAFKVLALFYIGGAQQSSDLFRCQTVDGGGDSLGDYAFLQKLPFISCCENSGISQLVHVTGCVTALFYVFIIPAANLHLFVRQYVVLKPSKTVMAVAEQTTAGWLARLQPLRQTKGRPQDHEHLLAAAVAHMAVALRGQVRLQLRDGQAEMRTAEEEFHTDAELNVSGFLETDDSTTQTLRSRAIMEMLVERCEMERVSTQDRLLGGAKKTFFQYAFCRYFWMQFVEKLLAVALLAVVSTDNALHLVLAIVLVMAATIAMVRPYLQPQMNDLQCLSMICLAGAAIGFSAGTSGDAHWLWLSRVSFLLPFLLAATQVLQPDSCEALAARLYQEARQKLPELKEEKEVELMVEMVSFL